MHTLHTSTADIYRWWTEENPDTELISLWNHGWCPLLQGIASLCCDCRRDVSRSNLTSMLCYTILLYIMYLLFYAGENECGDIFTTRPSNA